MDGSYYEGLPGFYQQRRDLLVAGLREAGFACATPAGSYYVMAGFAAIDGESGATDFAMRLLREAKVAGVPGSNFYLTPGLGDREIRFAFCKRIETIEAAVRNLKGFASGRRVEARAGGPESTGVAAPPAS
jgi:aspartate/methionine/tyrosine aminotransferase